MVRRIIFFFMLTLLLSGFFGAWWYADKMFKYEAPILFGIAMWPGYEFVNLAHSKGFFAEEGLNIRLVEFNTLQDTRQSFERGQIDGMTTTVIEVLQAYANSGNLPQVALPLDYSKGADLILARSSIRTVADLKGKKVGVEGQSVGTIILGRALEKSGLKFGDVDALDIIVTEHVKAIQNGIIDAAVSYPPYSQDVLAISGVSKIFDSSEIPGDVLDVISFKPEIFRKYPEISTKFRRALTRVNSYVVGHPEESYGFMGGREGLTIEQFKEALEGIYFLDEKEQVEFISNPEKLEKNIDATAKILEEAGELSKTLPGRNFIFRSDAP